MLYGAESIINSVIAKTICYILYKNYCLHLIYQMLRKRIQRASGLHYMKGLHGAAALRRYCSMLEHFTDVDRLIDAVYKLQ